MVRRAQHAVTEADRVFSDLAEIVAERTTAEWLELSERLGIPAAPVPTMDEIVNDPVRHRGVLRDEVHPLVGATATSRPPSSSPPRPPHCDAPPHSSVSRPMRFSASSAIRRRRSKRWSIEVTRGDLVRLRAC